MCISAKPFKRRREICMGIAVCRSSAAVNFAYCTVFTFRNVSNVCRSSKGITSPEHGLRGILSEPWVRSEWDKPAELHWMRPATTHPLQNDLSWPSCHLIQTSQVAQEGSLLISWTVCGHKPSWSPPFPLSCSVPASFSLSPSPSFSVRELKFFPKYVVWPVQLVLGSAGLR